jgi:hypothetical protein
MCDEGVSVAASRLAFVMSVLADIALGTSQTIVFHRLVAAEIAAPLSFTRDGIGA